MAKGVSRVQRSLKLLRSRGYTAAVVEKWNSFVKIRQDFFGCVDIIALREGETLAVQVCAGSGDVAKHVTKINAEPRARVIQLAGWKIVLHAWRKVGDRGKRKLWDCAEHPIVFSEDDLNAYRAAQHQSDDEDPEFTWDDADPAAAAGSAGDPD